MTNRNNTEINRQAPKKSAWPAWFPYPSSWLKAIVLALFLGIVSFVFTNTEEFGWKLAYFTNSPKLLLIFRILAILSPIFVITFTHHIFHIIVSQFFPSIQAPEIGNPKGFIPGLVSIWEGLYGWLVIWLSSLISFLILTFFFPVFDINFYRSVEFSTDYEDVVISIFGCIWIINAALLYQIDFLFKQRLLSVSSTTYKPEINRPIPSSSNPTTNAKPDNTNTVDVELDNLRGSMGLTHMKSKKTSLTNSQSSNKNTQEDNFETAINLAKNAAQLTRVAKTKSEWYQVGREWQKTIEMLKNVPLSHPKYAVAQEKIIDYQKYINYAQKIINSKHINN